LIDFHCHLDLYPDTSSVIAECIQRKIFVLAITTTPLAWEELRKRTEGGMRIRVAPGLHPELVPQRFSELPILLDLIKQSPYVGEVGIDGGRNLKEHYGLQVNVFKEIAASCASMGGRVISIHSRNAAKDVLDVIEKTPDIGIPILHWFSGSKNDLARAIKLGCWFSVGPGMLKSAKGKELLNIMPRDRVLTETDGPFVEMEGSTIMPWDVEKAEHLIADVWSISHQEVQETLIQNFTKIGSFAKSVSNGS